VSTHTPPSTSVVIVTYNSASNIVQCLDALFRDSQVPLEVIVYDNASGDGTPTLVRDRFPAVVLIEGPANVGFAAACNHGAAIAQGEYLAFINPDTRVAPGWLLPLIGLLESDPTAGAATPQIFFADRPEVVNACGNAVHFSGITYCREYGAPVSEKPPVEVGAVSGAAFVIRKRLFEGLGGFEASFFTYYEDTDLSLRIRCAGLRCVAVCASRVGHAYRPTFGSAKIFYLERNRYLSLLSLVAWPVLLLMLPSLVLMELAAWAYCLEHGKQAVSAKARSWLDLFRRWHWIMARRRQQGRCTTGNRWTCGAFSANLQVQYVDREGRLLAAVLERVGWLVARPTLLLAHALWG
jgi:GT2 family glycosyltransferase